MYFLRINIYIQFVKLLGLKGIDLYVYINGFEYIFNEEKWFQKNQVIYIQEI